MTKTLRTIVAAVMVASLVAVPASAQSDNAPNQGESLEMLLDEQQALIGQQQTLIAAQEKLLNAYRCQHDVDTHVVPGGCPGEAEANDEALLCAGWLSERERTANIRNTFLLIAGMMERGEGTSADNLVSQLTATNPIASYRDRAAAPIPAIMSERLAARFTAMVEALDAMIDAYAQRLPHDERAALIRSAIDRLDELDADLAELCT